jgi:hypothetical protein
VLSPSRPGPYKATHLAMRDRTVIQTGLIASSSISPVVVVISNSVGIECRSTSAYDRADNRAFLTTDCSANCGAGARSNRRG